MEYQDYLLAIIVLNLPWISTHLNNDKGISGKVVFGLCLDASNCKASLNNGEGNIITGKNQITTLEPLHLK